MINYAWPTILDHLRNKLKEISGEEFEVVETSDDKVGDLCIPTFKVAKKYGKNPVKLAEDLATVLMERLDELKYVDKVEAVRGYVNLFLKREEISRIVLNEIINLDYKYGRSEKYKGKTALVEHTSTNPIAPIHVGNLRNTCIGDCFSNLLAALGFNVKRHFYVNDCGVQVSTTAYGYDILKECGLEMDRKADAWLGAIYAIMNLFLSVQEFKEKLSEHFRIEDKNKYRIEHEEYEEYKKMLEKYTDEENKGLKGLSKDLDKLVDLQESLSKRFPKIYNTLLSKIKDVPDLRSEIIRMNRAYERREDEDVVKTIREMTEVCLDAFKDTFCKYGIELDSFDWESEIVWSDMVENVLKDLIRTGYVREEEKDGGIVKVLDIESFLRDFGNREEFGVPKDFEVPSMVLTRSDGTTLYVTRDLAYTIWKFENEGADYVYNVIATEQNLPQLQLKIALKILGIDDYYKRFVHLGYELVHLLGKKMKGRYAIYVTADDVLKEAVELAYNIVKDSNYSEEDKRKISHIVAVGAIKYSLLKTFRLKPIIFDMKKALDLNENSAPFIQYNHARAVSILNKASKEDLDGKGLDYSGITSDIEWKLLKILANYPIILERAVIELRPDLLCDYLKYLVGIFSKFYEKVPILVEKDRGVRKARLALLRAFRIVVRNALNLLGISAPSMM
ncbi:MAG: arginine--tRNA ligase [Candidatus Asgardarchaeia archaeon]